MKFCKTCGRKIEDDTTICPYCMEPQTKSSPQNNGFAVAGFILSLFGGGILAVIFSIIGLVKAPQYGDSGKGLSIAGIIISYVWYFVAFLVTIIILVPFLQGTV